LGRCHVRLTRHPGELAGRRNAGQRNIEAGDARRRADRAGTAHYDDVAVSIVNELGRTSVGFGIDADFGATASAAEVQSAINAAAPGAIAPAHMHRPHSGIAAGMAAALPKIRAVGFIFVRL
jgi:hypothetical protein